MFFRKAILPAVFVGWIFLSLLGAPAQEAAAPNAESPAAGVESAAPTDAALAEEAITLAPESDPAAEASRFRIDSTLTIEREEEIVKIQSSTIFSDKMVFDFIGDNGEIIIYSRDKGLFTLLDPIHRIQTELKQTEIDEFLANIRNALTEERNKFCLFMLNPAFDISRNDERGEIIFESKWVDYRIETRQFDAPELADDYFEFSDAYSLLNVYLNPGTLTPLARIKVNETLRAETRFPANISLSVYPKGKWLFAKMIQFQSEHKIVRRLSENDRGRMLRALLFSRQFPKMTFGKYYQTVNGGDQKR